MELTPHLPFMVSSHPTPVYPSNSSSVTASPIAHRGVQLYISHTECGAICGERGYLYLRWHVRNQYVVVLAMAIAAADDVFK